MFIKTRTERLKNQQREYEAQKQYREHLQVSYITYSIITVTASSTFLGVTQLLLCQKTGLGCSDAKMPEKYMQEITCKL